MNQKIFIISLICTILFNVYPNKKATATPVDTSIAIPNQIISNNSSTNSQNDSAKVILPIGLISAGLLLWYLSRSSKGDRSSSQFRNQKSNTFLLDRVSPKLRRQLLRLINDPKTANRLLVGIQKNNSDRSPNWLAEKAIYDLRRGR